MKKVNENKGFTLAELLIVVAVIAVLVAVAIPTFSAQLEKARQGVDVSNLRGAFAAARLAEMDGSVNNIPFKTYERHLRVGADDETDANTTNNTNNAKKYSSFWYDPDSGKLIAIEDKTNTGDPSAASKSFHTKTNDEKSEAAFKLFSLTSQKGKATGTRVQVDTSQLPGEGKKIVIYQDAQLERYEPETGDGKPYANETFHTGTTDKAIRVTFYHTQSDKFKLHEISFVMFANSPLYTEGTEDEVSLKLIAQANRTSTGMDSGDQLKTVGASDTGFTFNLSDIAINGMDYDDVKDMYTISVAAPTGFATDNDAPKVDGDTIKGKLAAIDTNATFTVTFRSKQDITVSGSINIEVTKGS